MNLFKKASPLSPEKISETFAETEYVRDEGKELRRVKPYYYCHNTFAKRRWIGRNVIEVLQEEFSLALEGKENGIQTSADNLRISVNLKAMKFDQLKVGLKNFRAKISNKKF